MFRSNSESSDVEIISDQNPPVKPAVEHIKDEEVSPMKMEEFELSSDSEDEDNVSLSTFFNTANTSKYCYSHTHTGQDARKQPLERVGSIPRCGQERLTTIGELRGRHNFAIAAG